MPSVALFSLLVLDFEWPLLFWPFPTGMHIEALFMSVYKLSNVPMVHQRPSQCNTVDLDAKNHGRGR